MSPGRDRGEWVLPAASGLLLAAAFPPFSILPAAFFGLAPLLVLVATLPAGGAGRWRALRAGLIAGAAYHGALLHWIPAALSDSPVLGAAAFVGCVLLLATLIGLFTLGLHRVLEVRPRWSLALAAAALWTAAEWIQAHLGTLAFPWLGLGTALAGWPALAGAADLVGARGLGFGVALVNGLAATAVLLARRGARPWPPLATAALLVVAASTYGAYRAATLETRPVARVAVVHPALPQAVRMDPERGVDASYQVLSRLTRRLRPGVADVVVWPEAALPTALDGADAEPLRRGLVALARHAGAPLLVGAYAEAEAGGFLNATFVVRQDGRVERVYAKRRLVPFIERVPFGGARLASVLGDSRYGGLVPGTESVPVRVAGIRLGVLICYESAFAPLARAHRSAGAQLLVSSSNDGWFGGPGRGAGAALLQHPAHLVLRAIETRTGIARAAGVGHSHFVRPDGTVHDAGRPYEPALLVATVHSIASKTLYARWGDWVGILALLLTGLMLLPRRGVRRARPVEVAVPT